jgi:serine/threonine-protein kinase
MSPEQALGETVDARSDLFSFGILLAELLTGRHPFRRTTAEATLAAIIRDPPAIATDRRPIPPAMTIIVRRLLAKHPADRYPSITDVRRDLAALSGSGAAPSAPAVSVAGRGSTRFPLVGRDAERATLLAGLDAAIAGRGSFVMIAGEPGIRSSSRNAWRWIRTCNTKRCISRRPRPCPGAPVRSPARRTISGGQRTNAGIAAAAAGEWAIAEKHYRAALTQAETLGLRVAAADAREWYARMLLARSGPDDRARASALLAEAVARYDALGMTAFAERARRLAG